MSEVQRIMMTRRWYGLLLATLLAAGCADKARSTAGADGKKSYETISADPVRDSELAKKENDKCIGLLKEKKWAAAEEAGKRALGADLMFGPAHNNLGKAYYGQGKLYLAAWEFQYAAKLMPNVPEPKNNLGLVYEAAGRLEEAQNSYEQGLAIGPENQELLGNFARVRVRRGEKGPEIRELLGKVALRDERPAWRDWARGKLALMKEKSFDPTSSPSSTP